MLKLPFFTVLAASVVVAPIAAGAHHSTEALFDRGKTIEFEAILQKVDIINPHSWWEFLQITGPDQAKEWKIEGGAPSQIRRAIIEEFGSLEFEVGKKYKVKINPARADEADGYLRQLVMPDGSIFICC